MGILVNATQTFCAPSDVWLYAKVIISNLLTVQPIDYFKQWTNHRLGDFEVLSFEDFSNFESFFKVNMEVYSLEEDGLASSIYKSRGLQETTMYVNMYENHLSYIRDFSVYAQKLVSCFGFYGPLRPYFSLYRVVSQREGEREEKG